jgi:porin
MHYVQYNATRTVQFALGLQATNNPTGETLTLHGASEGCCAWFAYTQWTPLFPGLGTAQYSLSYFDTPAIPGRPSSRDWSLNAVQNLDKTWAIFGRANTASGAAYPIKSSYALGVAMNNPLKRATTDQIAVAVGDSDVAAPPGGPPNARDERIVEAYWRWTLLGGLLLTPSVQVIFDPALNASRTSVTVLSMRATLLF